MTRQDVQFRTAWFGYRKSDVRNCMEHLYALNAQDQRLARETQRELEDRMELVEQENSSLRQSLAQRTAAEVVASAQAQDAQSQVEMLTRRLAAAQSELRKYQTRLFACEREALALRRENAELEALCEKARECGITLDEEERDGLEGSAPELPALAVAERVEPLRCAQPPAKAPSADPVRWQPKTELERLSVQLLDQMEKLLQE